MISDKYKNRIIKNGIKAAHRYKKKTGQKPDKEVLKKISIPTASLFERLVLIILGIVFIAIAIYNLSYFPFWIILLQIVFGLIILILGIRGRRKKISKIIDIFDAIDIGANILQFIVEGIIDSIDV